MPSFYGTGHALVDYFFDSEIPLKKLSSELQAAAAAQIPVHIPGSEFDRLLEQLHSHVPDWAAASDSVRTTGGTCVNMLKTLAALGAKTEFSGCCGGVTEENTYRRDEEALFFQKSLAQSGVAAQLLLVQGRTGRCLVVHSGRQSFILAVSPDAAVRIGQEQLNYEKCLKSDWFIIEGMPIGKSSIRIKIEDLLSRAHCRIAFACGTPAGAKNIALLLKNQTQLPKTAAVIFANDTEARILENAGIDLATYSANTGMLFVITHGCRGSSAYDHGKRITVPAHPVAATVTDETGAGDVFAGAFLYKLTERQKDTSGQNEDIGNCLKFAAAAAAKIVTVPLCRITPDLCAEL